MSISADYTGGLEADAAQENGYQRDEPGLLIDGGDNGEVYFCG